ncbi:MAG: hypothetical protein ICV55_04380 [Coleofasciculus sp. C3-bin4]|jgi:hypothetical protein|nr:hypothetical protein [Coleofasciculus sp. Co-bin14]MBD0362009.1 hypothetical protein [Coleofasciculus sp. C3-bin4]
MFQQIVIAVLDENACFQEVALERTLELGRERALAEDKALGIKRDYIPFRLILLPNTPLASDCHKLAEKIRAVARFDIIPENKNQALWMRCVMLYWQVKAIRLANLVFPVIPDPLRPGGPLSKILPSKDIENLKLETEADKTLYDLLEAGEPLIIDWAKAKGIDWSFQDYQELFIDMLEARFKRHWQEEAFNPVFSRLDKKSDKKHYRQWLRFLSDQFDGEPLEKEYSKVLMDMGWEGYPLLALRPQKRRKPFNELWKAYLKAHKAAANLIDDNLHFNKGLPYQTKQTSQKAPLQGKVTDDGYIYWVWS